MMQCSHLPIRTHTLVLKPSMSGIQRYISFSEIFEAEKFYTLTFFAIVKIFT